MKLIRLFIFAGLLLCKVAAAQPQELLYAEVDGEKLFVDVYLPPKHDAASDTRRPGVVLIHGGGWCMGSRKDVANEARALAGQGYPAFAISYRLCNGPAREENQTLPVRNRFPAALDDCQRAVRWIRSRAAEFHVDPDRLAAIGWSAGGHLASLLGTMDTRDNSDPALAKYSSRVNAVVNVFGPADFTQPLPETTLRGEPVNEKGDSWVTRKPVRWLVDDFLGSTDELRQRIASPVYYIGPKTAPFLVVHGTLDQLVPIKQSHDFVAKLKAAGVDAELLEFPGEGHGWGKPETRQRFAEKVLSFLDRTIRSPKTGA